MNVNLSSIMPSVDSIDCDSPADSKKWPVAFNQWMLDSIVHLHHGVLLGTSSLIAECEQLSYLEELLLLQLYRASPDQGRSHDHDQPEECILSGSHAASTGHSSDFPMALPIFVEQHMMII